MLQHSYCWVLGGRVLCRSASHDVGAQRVGTVHADWCVGNAPVAGVPHLHTSLHGLLWLGRAELLCRCV
jgi:hypothetical protein